MSRRIPPIPVAAPWKGSTAKGWLWLSTLNATASPSPRSITPAFSPGPWRTRSPLEGRRRRSSAECLYPQCSDQRSEKTASSKWFGSRPRSSSISAASVSVSPRARWSGCSATWLVNEASLSAFEDEPLVPDPSLERVRGIAREPPPVARPAAHRERGGGRIPCVLVRVVGRFVEVEAGGGTACGADHQDARALPVRPSEMTGRRVGVQIETRVDLDKERQPQVVEGPEREKLAQ